MKNPLYLSLHGESRTLGNCLEEWRLFCHVCLSQIGSYRDQDDKFMTLKGVGRFEAVRGELISSRHARDRHQLLQR